MIHSAIQRRRRAASSFVLGLCVMSGAYMLQVKETPAQSRSTDLAVFVPPAMQVAPGSETPLAIELAGGVLPRRAILLIRGLPSSVTLSGGRLFESGVWGVPATDIERVTIASKAGATGRSDLNFSLVSIDGTVLAEARSTLVIGGGAGVIARNNKNDPSDQTVYTATSPQEIPANAAPFAAATVKHPSAGQSDQLMALVHKGDEQFRVGNISAARLLYRHAAENGLAAAALALAATYDEEELKKLPVRGTQQADQQQAQLWYQKANELGSAEARSRLQRLGAR